MLDVCVSKENYLRYSDKKWEAYIQKKISENGKHMHKSVVRCMFWEKRDNVGGINATV